MSQSQSGPDAASTAPPSPTDQAATFVWELFRFAEHDVFLTTLPNERGTHGNRHERRCAATRDGIEANVGRVLDKYDKDGQAIYFCASSISGKLVAERHARMIATEGKPPLSERSKETVGEIVALWVDIDLKNIKLGKTELYRRLALLRLLPTVVDDSGNGVHVWYFLNEAMPATPENVCELETLLGQMCFSLGGDKSCCEVARLMRLPGSHNTKNGAWKPVQIQAEYSDFNRRYDFEELKEFWRDEPRVLSDDELVTVTDKRTGKSRRRADGDEPENTFAAYIRGEIEAGHIHMPPLDVEKLLGGMIHGHGERGVHNTMLLVTSSLVSPGGKMARFLDLVLKGVGAWVAAGGLPKGWRPEAWPLDIESRARAQIAGAIRKADPAKLAKARERRASERKRPHLAVVPSAECLTLSVGAAEIEGEHVMEQPAAAATSTGSNVVTITPKKRGRPKKEEISEGADHVRLALATLEKIRLEGRDICFWRGELWIYEGGIWRAYEGKGQNNWLETRIHDAVRVTNAVVNSDDTREEGNAFAEDAKLRTETCKYLCTMPELHFNGEFDAHGLTPLANGLFDPSTRTLTPYTPEHRATYRFAASYDPAATFVHGKQMLADMFMPYGAEKSGEYVRLIQQFAYVAIFKSGQRVGRRLRRCLYFHGPKFSGKSQMIELLSRAIGPERCSRTTLVQLGSKDEGRFALETMMDKAAWIADEVADEHTKIPAGIVKALWAEDEIKADRKGKQAIQKRFLGSTALSSNNLPRTLDTASGFADRFMLIYCPAQFSEKDLTGVAKIARERGFTEPVELVAATELSGFLNWALEAREQIETNKCFDEPADVVAAREALAKSADPIQAFAEECLEEYPINFATVTNNIYEAYREWYAEDHGTKTTAKSPKVFWAKINEYYNRRRGTVSRKAAKSYPDKRTYACGIKLNENGISYWQAAKARLDGGDKDIRPLATSGRTMMTDITDVGDQLAKVRAELCS